ncbi:hypothetical protein FO519_009699 [Halicephalobus sp. NKZ332]|nr:hypothetical protein FO519_009699 [Halicephalobus sp. NKZ332]
MINQCLIILLLLVLQAYSENRIFHAYFSGSDRKHYVVTELEDPFSLEITIMEPHEVTKTFPLSNCNFTKNGIYRAVKIQENSVYIHVLTDEGEFLKVVNLTALSNDITNGNCILISDAYFGKYKVYVYKIEEKNILKRWLVTPDGKLTNPVEVVRIEEPILYVYVYPENININIRTEGSSSHYMYKNYTDLPRCDVPWDSTSCEENQVPGEKSEIVSATDQPITGSSETSTGTTFYHDFKIVVITIIVYLFIQIILGVGYYFSNLRSKSQGEGRSHLNRGFSGDLDNRRTRNNYSRDIPMT